ncbi:MAG: hypothetical protein EAZ99_07820 [Alphaproteobacteria bacterium]|nr:MAG: hypothetical protein EAZ99_07820 [Alphaproteobacteria bacterium]
MLMALDLATRTGMAVGGFGSRPVTSSVDCGGRTGGARYAHLQDWLSDQIAVHQPQVLVCEAPIMMDHRSADTALLTVGLLAVVELTAARSGLIRPVFTLPVSTIRKAFCGTGRAKKHDVAQRCAQLGFSPRDDNEADALACWYVAINHSPDIRAALR